MDMIIERSVGGGAKHWLHQMDGEYFVSGEATGVFVWGKGRVTAHRFADWGAAVAAVGLLKAGDGGWWEYSVSGIEDRKDVKQLAEVEVWGKRWWGKGMGSEAAVLRLKDKLNLWWQKEDQFMRWDDFWLEYVESVVVRDVEEEGGK